ncbi:MAG: glutathione S-transferase [Proteobacteria bacterium]|nr:glutathione S-transferase [Pseudomonadota bacterium]
MSQLTFYTNPQSRGQIIRWMLEELGAPYETVLLDYGGTMKAPEYLAINPMGKVPAIRHGDRVVTECAAICAYLADAFPEAGLAPAPADRHDYYRWLFFTAGPIEAVFTAKAMGWEVPAERQAMAGFGNFDLALNTIAGAVAGKAFIAGDRFSAADIYVASQLDFMLTFKLVEPRAEFDAYLGPLRGRPAFRRAKEIDAALIAGAG